MKKLMIAMVMALMTYPALSSGPFKNNKVILVITVEVSQVAEWKAKFDAGAPVREKAGIKVLGICTNPDNEKIVTVIEEADNAQAAHDFLLKMKAAREKSGDNSVIKEVKILDKID